MTDDTMAFFNLVRERGGGDLLKDLAEAVLQKRMDYDVENLVGAARYERNEARTTQRNGFRERNLETRLGTLDLKIPKLRQGSYFPAFLEPRKTAERALVAVVQEAWIEVVSTRKVDDLVQAAGRPWTPVASAGLWGMSALSFSAPGSAHDFRTT